jgi:DNA-binding GntR family transcriptional regulator
MGNRIQLEPIEKGALWDRAYSSLKNALLAGRYRPGERILLRSAADALGISLTPVRDAVNRLIAEKVLERGSVGQKGGATVPLLSVTQFDQLMTVRAALEAHVTGLAAQRASKADLDKIESQLLEMKRSVEEGRIEKYLDAHYQFHFGIYRIADTPLIMDMIESAWLRCGPTLTLALPQYIPGLKRYPYHVNALKALRKKDASGASDAIRMDIESARIDISALMRAEAP